MDIFIEKIVARKRTAIDTLITFGTVFLGIILVFLCLSIPALASFSVILAAAVIFGIYIIVTQRNVEYEYAVTNGDLDIDKIISRRKRKRVFSASCKDFEIVAKLKSQHYTSDVKNIQKRIEAVSSIDSPDVYFVTLSYKGDRTVLFFEPDQRMLNAFKTYIPRKVMME